MSLLFLFLNSPCRKYRHFRFSTEQNSYFLLPSYPSSLSCQSLASACTLVPHIQCLPSPPSDRVSRLCPSLRLPRRPPNSSLGQSVVGSRVDPGTLPAVSALFLRSTLHRGARVPFSSHHDPAFLQPRAAAWPRPAHLLPGPTRPALLLSLSVLFRPATASTRTFFQVLEHAKCMCFQGFAVPSAQSYPHTAVSS